MCNQDDRRFQVEVRLASVGYPFTARFASLHAAQRVFIEAHDAGHSVRIWNESAVIADGARIGQPAWFNTGYDWKRD